MYIVLLLEQDFNDGFELENGNRWLEFKSMV